MTRVHIMGLEGVGMSALARLLLGAGIEVTGCDLAPGRRAESLGVPVHRGHDPAHLQEEDTLVVPTPIPLDHPEVEEARRKGMRVLRRMELLAHLLRQRPSLGVTGTHGKTTTTGMLASILLAAGLDPWVLLGGELSLLPGNARFGLGPRLAEVDESDPLFQEVEVEVAVATNLEADHIAPAGQRAPNYHASLEELEKAMRGFLSRAKTVVVPTFDPRLLRLSQGLPRKLFGEGGDLWAEETELGPTGSRFQLVYQGRTLGEARLQVPGAHNVQNALAAALAALSFGVEPEAILEGLALFPGGGAPVPKNRRSAGCVGGGRLRPPPHGGEGHPGHRQAPGPPGSGALPAPPPPPYPGALGRLCRGPSLRTRGGGSSRVHRRGKGGHLPRSPFPKDRRTASGPGKTCPFSRQGGGLGLRQGLRRPRGPLAHPGGRGRDGARLEARP